MRLDRAIGRDTAVVQTETQARKTIKLLYISNFLSGCVVIMAILVPYYSHIGLTQTQIFVLQGAFVLGLAFCQVPTGYLADRFGRRGPLVVGMLITTVAYGILALTHNFWVMLLAWVIMSVGWSFKSGAKALGHEVLKRFPFMETKAFASRLYSSAYLGGMLGGMLGSLLATLGFTLVMALQVLLGICMTLTVVKARDGAPVHASVRARSWRAQTKIVRGLLKSSPPMRWLMMCHITFWTTLYPIIWLAQSYYGQVGVPLALYGVLFALQQGASWFFAEALAWYKGGRWGLPAIATVLTAGPYLAMGIWSHPIVLIAILAVAIARAWIFAAMTDWVNNSVTNDIRATMLGLGLVIGNTGGFFIGLAAGYLVDHASLQTSMIFMGVLTLLMGVPTSVVGLFKMRHVTA